MQRKLYVSSYLKIACHSMQEVNNWKSMRNSEKKITSVLSSILQYVSKVLRAYHETKD